jgi:hypothetical protein
MGRDQQNFTTGFQYEQFQISCRGKSVSTSELWKKSRPRLLTYIAKDDELKGALGVIDFEKTSLTGYKKVGNRNLVQYLFSSRLRSDIILPQEGGVSVVVDACTGKTIYADFFGLP